MEATTQKLTDPDVIAAVIQTWDSYYGLQVCDVGDDGDILVFGHNDNRRTLAAIARHSRVWWGVSMREWTLAEAEANTVRRWARLIEPDPGEDWRITWGARADDVGAFPVTHWCAP